jgi:hypothetical protein
MLLSRFLGNKVFYLLGPVILFLSACQTQPQINAENITIETKFKRFDEAFFTCDTNRFEPALRELKQKYPLFFQNQGTQKFWYTQRTEPLQNKLFERSQAVFGNLSAQNEALNQVMKRYYKLFGTADTLAFFTYISRLDFGYPILPADSVYFVALDLYLGSKSPYYQSMPRYLAFEREPRFLVRDIAETLLKEKIAPTKKQETLLDAMVYHGKILYFIEAFMPELSEKDLMQYPPKKLNFAREHEREMWIYFIENEMLFKSSAQAKKRFIELAPFSKFRTELDANTPGRIGQWFGYKIVKAFHQKNPQLSFKQVWQENNSEKILKLSAYKP